MDVDLFNNIPHYEVICDLYDGHTLSQIEELLEPSLLAALDLEQQIDILKFLFEAVPRTTATHIEKFVYLPNEFEQPTTSGKITAAGICEFIYRSTETSTIIATALSSNASFLNRLDSYDQTNLAELALQGISPKHPVSFEHFNALALSDLLSIIQSTKKEAQALKKLLQAENLIHNSTPCEQQTLIEYVGISCQSELLHVLALTQRVTAETCWATLKFLEEAHNVELNDLYRQHFEDTSYLSKYSTALREKFVIGMFRLEPVKTLRYVTVGDLTPDTFVELFSSLRQVSREKMSICLLVLLEQKHLIKKSSLVEQRKIYQTIFNIDDITGIQSLHLFNKISPEEKYAQLQEYLDLTSTKYITFYQTFNCLRNNQIVELCSDFVYRDPKDTNHLLQELTNLTLEQKYFFTLKAQFYDAWDKVQATSEAVEISHLNNPTIEKINEQYTSAMMVKLADHFFNDKIKSSSFSDYCIQRLNNSNRRLFVKLNKELSELSENITQLSTEDKQQLENKKIEVTNALQHYYTFSRQYSDWDGMTDVARHTCRVFGLNKWQPILKAAVSQHLQEQKKTLCSEPSLSRKEVEYLGWAKKILDCGSAVPSDKLRDIFRLRIFEEKFIYDLLNKFGQTITENTLQELHEYLKQTNQDHLSRLEKKRIHELLDTGFRGITAKTFSAYVYRQEDRVELNTSIERYHLVHYFKRNAWLVANGQDLVTDDPLYPAIVYGAYRPVNIEYQPFLEFWNGELQGCPEHLEQIENRGENQQGWQAVDLLPNSVIDKIWHGEISALTKHVTELLPKRADNVSFENFLEVVARLARQGSLDKREDVSHIMSYMLKSSLLAEQENSFAMFYKQVYKSHLNLVQAKRNNSITQKDIHLYLLNVHQLLVYGLPYAFSDVMNALINENKIKPALLKFHHKYQLDFNKIPEVRVNQMQVMALVNSLEKSSSMTLKLIKKLSTRLTQGNHQRLVGLHYALNKTKAGAFGRASAGICTYNHFEVWKRKDFLQIMMLDLFSARMQGNIQCHLWTDPKNRPAVLVRPNPNMPLVEHTEPDELTDLTMAVLKKFCKDNNLVAYLPKHDANNYLTDRHQLLESLESYYDITKVIDLPSGIQVGDDMFVMEVHKVIWPEV